MEVGWRDSKGSLELGISYVNSGAPGKNILTGNSNTACGTDGAVTDVTYGAGEVTGPNATRIPTL